MAGQKGYLHIKSQKIKDRIDIMGKKLGEVSVEMGHDQSYLSHRLSERTMKKSDLFMLSHIIGVEYDALVGVEEVVINNDTTKTTNIDLTEIISLFEENNRLLQEIIEMWKVPVRGDNSEVE